MLKISKNCLKITQRPEKYPEIIYIYLYFYGRALASSRRELDARKRSRDVATPKKRTLGLTPGIFLEVDVPKTHKQVSLATPRIYLSM